MRTTLHWEPENPAFWAREGARIAQRNLAVSSAALAISFAVWMMWSVTVVHLPRVGFHFTPNQLFWLAAAPGLSGAVLRLFFVFMVPIFGGRTWTTVSTLALLVPTVGLAVAVQDTGTAYPTFMLLALAAGIGGGNFASSVANISIIYPNSQRGTALGWNAGIGNLGVAAAQLAIPAAVGVSLFGALGGAPQAAAGSAGVEALWLQNAGFVWVLPIVLIAGLAWLNMSDVEVRASFAEQSIVFVRPQTWVLAWLYLGTFGSFVGFAAAFPLLADRAFEGEVSPMLAFVGPLLAAVARPLGGWLADARGGGRVALGAFAALAVATVALLAVEGGAGPAPFVTLFAVLFVASGVGNGAVFQLIPAVFVADRRAALAGTPGGHERAIREGSLEGAAALGLASGIAAFGGFFIPKAYGTAAGFFGAERYALYAFVLFYASCIAVTWWCYVRHGASTAHIHEVQQ